MDKGGEPRQVDEAWKLKVYKKLQCNMPQCWYDSKKSTHLNGYVMLYSVQKLDRNPKAMATHLQK
jgi:hypothetical protein